MEWRDEAACTDLPWEYRLYFFGEGAELPVHEQHERARMICYLCPVQMECLGYWLDTEGEFGIWGGLTISQRKRYLLPTLRRSKAPLEETMVEVVFNAGTRLYPKIRAAHERLGRQSPLLPVVSFASKEVLLEILSHRKT